MSDDNDLASPLSRTEILDQARVDRHVVEIVVGLVYDERSIVLVLGLQVQKKKNDPFFSGGE